MQFQLYATREPIGGLTPVEAAEDGAGSSRDLFNIATSSVFTGSTGFGSGSKTNFGYCAFGKSASRHGECLISVRGTVTASDWLTDGKFAGARGPSGFGVHKGFSQVAKGILPQITSALKRKNPSVIHIVGHSLGGATATLLADSLRDHTAVKLYTFGAPRAGGEQHAMHLTQKLGSGNIYRAYHDTDPVPMLPIFPYTHCPTLKPGYLLKGSGLIISPGAHLMQSYKTNCGDRWSSLATIPHRRFSLDTVDDLLQQAGEIPGGMFSAFVMRCLVQALDILLEIVGMAVGCVAFGAATVSDQIAFAISRGVQLSGEIALRMEALVHQLMRFLGIAVSAGHSMSTAFLRWISSKLVLVLEQFARQAVNAL